MRLQCQSWSDFGQRTLFVDINVVDDFPAVQSFFISIVKVSVAG